MLMQVVLTSVLLVCGTVLPAQDNNTQQCSKQTDCEVEDNHRPALKWTDDDVDFTKFEIPEDFSMEEILKAVIHPDGPGWTVLRGMYSEEDVRMARERVIHHTNTDFFMRKLDHGHDATDEVHNNYRGLVWNLLSKGKVFQKMVQHPVILNISNAILGQDSQISSLAANTVLPGMKGQQPHLDYPYYRNFLPTDNPTLLDNAPPLALQFVTLLTDFNLENGGTAVRPESHIRPRYPDDAQDFFDNAIQMTGKAGDVVIFHGAIQHCAMPNKSKDFRSGILQHMAPIYVKPFENVNSHVSDEVREGASPRLRQVLALDHPYPLVKE